MARDRDLNFSEVCEISWIQYLDAFNEQVWPVFKERGFSKDMALQVWMLNKIFNELECIYENGIPIAHIEEDDNGSSEFKT